MGDSKTIQFCFIVCSFNNEKNIEKNLTSIISQKNTNWRCIYTNDCSSDETESLFFDIIKKYNVEPKFIYKKNDENRGQCYSKYIAYKLVEDFEVVCILDGDDWLSDTGVLDRLADIYSDKTIDMVSSNFKIWIDDSEHEHNSWLKYESHIITNKEYRKNREWFINHLKTGYGIFFKSIPKNYLTNNGEWLKVCTDIAEYFSALELSKGKYVAVDDIMYVYNKTNSINYSTSYYNDESRNMHKRAFDYITSLSPCKYFLPQTYIINMAKCDKKREYMEKQMVFQSNTTYTFIEAVDGSISLDTNIFLKNYYEYMNIKTTSQLVEYNRSIMIDSYKDKYNYSRQHITKGSLGLIQSAFLLLKKFMETDSEHALILEDDVYTYQNFNENLFINEENLKDKDLVYLGCHVSSGKIYTKSNTNIFIDISDYEELIYGTYSIIISKRLASYILDLGIDHILRLNLSWDLLLNYIRDTDKQFTSFLYFKQLFIPNVIKKGGINNSDLRFYIRNKILFRDYYIPDANKDDSDNTVAKIMVSHNEIFFFEFITKTVYINLEARIDRKEHAETQLLMYISPTKIDRFNAIRHSNGGIGCGLSHIDVLEMASANNWDNVLIVEDDITWTNTFNTCYPILEKLIKESYDVIVLGGSFVKSYKNNFKLISCNCALAYIVNKSYYQTLIDCFKKAVLNLSITRDYRRYAIDQAWKVLQARDNWFIVKPNMCIQLPDYSNIEGKFKDYRNYFDELEEYDNETGLLVNSVQSVNVPNKKFNPNPIEPKGSTDQVERFTFNRQIINRRLDINEEPDSSPLEKIVFNGQIGSKRLNISREETFIPSNEKVTFNSEISNKKIYISTTDDVVKETGVPEDVRFNSEISNKKFHVDLEDDISPDLFTSEEVTFNSEISNKKFYVKPAIDIQPESTVDFNIQRINSKRFSVSRLVNKDKNYKTKEVNTIDLRKTPVIEKINIGNKLFRSQDYIETSNSNSQESYTLHPQVIHKTKDHLHSEVIFNNNHVNKTFKPPPHEEPPKIVKEPTFQSNTISKKFNPEPHKEEQPPKVLEEIVFNKDIGNKKFSPEPRKEEQPPKVLEEIVFNKDIGNKKFSPTPHAVPAKISDTVVLAPSTLPIVKFNVKHQEPVKQKQAEKKIVSFKKLMQSVKTDQTK